MSKKFTKTLLSSSLVGLLVVSAEGFAQASVYPKDSQYSVLVDDAKQDVFGSKFKVYYSKSSHRGVVRYVQNGKDNVLFHFGDDGNILVLSKDGQIGYTVHEPVLKDFARMAEGLKVGKGHKLDEAEVQRIYNKVYNMSNTVVNPALKNQVGELSGRVDQLAQDTNTRLVVEAKKSREYTDSRTTVGVKSDGTLTSADGATKTIAVNDGLVALSGRTDSVDRRVTKNTQAIQSNTRQLQEHNARLNSQQRQIRENHEEMKRAAAQSAALAGLFQPYSVGKFNATAALGGYSDKQAIAVGVGYRFNEQTAAKAGIAASDGDVSYNMGVNFEF
ncbi:YadA-like family protein [Escherichia coli]|uniref:YadA C-terminal domain-containing protein n=1 Tax=Escherichia coli TaxID=562 RepID=UPI00163A0B7A|nr:YadA C-terminal domain-containing protein [Escherichia coli]EIG0328714.1 YadA-like family protein [Escherichia coli]ELV2813021.1 YadA-like family protein [Escherichia coli]MCN6871744.1 YadA-like family protein [Escherichia coli]MCN7639830.1 YadA-like family protein [Escherichia coli]MCV0470211.1 YadA-like family protein [Escherichia coli]